jgi:hypothetical protein
MADANYHSRRSRRTVVKVCPFTPEGLQMRPVQHSIAVDENDLAGIPQRSAITRVAASLKCRSVMTFNRRWVAVCPLVQPHVLGHPGAPPGSLATGGW